MEQERLKKIFKIFRIIATASAAVSALFFLLSLAVFVPMIFIRENLTVEAGGILGFFLDVVKEGENPITSADLVLSVMPRFVQLFLFLLLSLCFASALKKGEKEATLAFCGAKKAFARLSLLSFLSALLPSVLTKVARATVSRDFFNITETSYTGWLVLALVLLLGSLLLDAKGSSREKEG